MPPILLLSMSSIQIIYGTTGGNTELVCRTVAEFLREAGQEVSLKRAEMAVPEDLTSHDLLILACPTYGHGELEPHYLYFHKKIQKVDLAGQNCTVIALGDAKYDEDHRLESSGILLRYITTHGGKLLCPPLAINKSPIPVLQTQVKDWTDQLIQKLSPLPQPSPTEGRGS